MKKQLCQEAWETHSQGFAEIQLVPPVSLRYTLNQLWPCRAPRKSRSMCAADYFLPTRLNLCVFRNLSSHCVPLPLYPVLGTARKQLSKGMKTGATDCEQDLIVLVHMLHLSHCILSKIWKLVRERCVMQRGVIFPQSFCWFILCLSETGRRKSTLQKL